MLANIAYFAVLTPAEMLASKATAVVSETKDLKSVAEFSEPHSQIHNMTSLITWLLYQDLNSGVVHFQLKMLVVSLYQN